MGIINFTLRITKVALNIQDFAFCLVPRSVDDLFIIQDKIELLMISFWDFWNFHFVVIDLDKYMPASFQRHQYFCSELPYTDHLIYSAWLSLSTNLPICSYIPACLPFLAKLMHLGLFSSKLPFTSYFWLMILLFHGLNSYYCYCSLNLKIYPLCTQMLKIMPRSKEELQTSIKNMKKNLRRYSFSPFAHWCLDMTAEVSFITYKLAWW